MQNELNSDIASFTIYIKPVLQKIRFLTGLTLNIAFQLVFAEVLKNKLHVFVVRFTEALRDLLKAQLLDGWITLSTG